MKTAPVGYFDIETHQWAHFVVGALLPPGADRPEFYWHRPEGLLDGMAERPGTVWRAHYSGRFDTLLLLTLAARAGWRMDLSMRGASVVRARLRRPGDKKTTITLEDTYALAPVGLAKFARAAGGEQKGAWDHDRTPKRVDPASPLGRELAGYLAADVLSLRDADTAWRAVLREVAGVEPSLTLGGTAWKSASRLSEWPRGEDVTEPLPITDYSEGREGYFGGRVEVFRPAESQVWRYDRNSSYPAALTLQPVPWGRRRWTRKWDGEDGTVWATVQVPECRHPPLPVRTRKGRVVFPVGRLSGVWTGLELRRAVQLGARVTRVHRARLPESMTDALGEWCRRVWAARVERPAWGGLLKLLANSLTGKLAQKPERTSVLYCHVDEAPPNVDHPLTEPGEDGMAWFKRTVELVATCARPEWAAYLTAEARGELLEQLNHAGDDTCYCDTDSVYSARPLTRGLGAELGQWKTEGRASRWLALAPKLYRYDTDDGEAHVKGKGLPGLSVDGFEALRVMATLSKEDPRRDELAWKDTRGVESLLSTLKQQGEAAFTRRTIERGLNGTPGRIGGRIVDGDATRAPTLKEAEGW